MSDGLDFSEVSTGERVKCGARLDDGVYTAFRQWVEDETGNQYMEVGRALDRAMLEYMTDDKQTEIHEQTKKNEALLRKLINKVDSEKVKEKGSSQSVPQGKDPGSRQEREAHVIRELVKQQIDTVTLETLKQAIREVAGVSTDRTVKDYADAITATAAFQSHPRQATTWHLDYDGAADVLARRNVPLPQEVSQ